VDVTAGLAALRIPLATETATGVRRTAVWLRNVPHTAALERARQHITAELRLVEAIPRPAAPEPVGLRLCS
jgi:hypothetical protein